MNTKRLLVVNLMLIAALMLAACGGGDATPAAQTAATDVPAPAATTAPAATAIATAAGPVLGDEERAPLGGFAFQTIPGYTITNEGDLVSMEAADALPNVGPGFILLGGPNNEGVQTADAFELYMQQFTNVAVVDEAPLQVNSYAGHVHNFTAQANGSDVRGRFVALAPADNSQLVVLIVLAPPAAWAEVEPYAGAVTNSLSFFEPEGDAANVLRQWATYTQSSSSKSVSGDAGTAWSAEMALGAPDNLDCTFDLESWSPDIATFTEDWLIVQFDRPVDATELILYAAAGPVPLTRVEVYDADNFSYEVYTSDAAIIVEGCPGEVYVPIDIDAKVVSARLYFDAALSSLSTAIDAVELVGEITPRAAPPAGMIEQWASQATASGEYHPASDATGPQDSWLCNTQRSWTSSYDGNTIDTLDVTFDTPVVPSEMQIYESYNAGQITKVELLGTDGTYYEVYAGAPEVIDECPSAFNLIFGEDFTQQVIGARITVDQTVNGQTYIDAVALLGRP